MARVMSLAMMVFVLVPAVAPAIGQVIIGFFDWRAIFLAFVIFSLMSGAWLALRQPETHPPERRLSLEPARLLGALAEVAGSRVVMIYTAVLSLTFGILFAVLSATQPIFDVSFGRAESFPAWFAAIALASGTASLVNAALVVRLGMRRMVLASFTALVGLSALAAAATALGILGTAAAFPAHILWTTAVFFSAGMTIGNLNALALEPMGHIAGLASSAVGAISTVLGVAIAVPIGLAFDGTPLPLYLGVLATASLALVLVRTSPKATEVSI
jgi:DHA1 family bicyclomycin/chloramphenicol resistance-like MFS transporter